MSLTLPVDVVSHSPIVFSKDEKQVSGQLRQAGIGKLSGTIAT